MKCDAWFCVGQRGNEWSVKQLSKDSVCIACSIKERGGENLNSKRHIGGQTDQYKIRLGGPRQILYWSAARQYLFLKKFVDSDVP